MTRADMPQPLVLSRLAAERFGVPEHHEDISTVLDAVGFYARYVQAVRRVIPDYSCGWKSKIVLPSVLDRRGFRRFSLVAEATGLPPAQVERIYADIDAKRSATAYLHLWPALVDVVPEIKTRSADP
jgi:hypothetical protein